jgi:hypothetical protein
LHSRCDPFHSIHKYTADKQTKWLTTESKKESSNRKESSNYNLARFLEPAFFNLAIIDLERFALLGMISLLSTFWGRNAMFSALRLAFVDDPMNGDGVDGLPVPGAVPGAGADGIVWGGIFPFPLLLSLTIGFVFISE